MERIAWNEGWQFTQTFTPELCQNDYAGPTLQPVRIPHTVQPLPYNYAQADSYQMVSGYRKVFTTPAGW